MARPRQKTAAQRPLVLVVEDDPSARRSMSRLVRAAGCDVETYGSAEGLLRRSLDRPQWHCLILDLALPGLGGLEALAQLRGPSRPPVIVVSALDDEDARATAREAGVFAYMAKPYAPEMLVARLLDAIAQPPRGRQVAATPGQAGAVAGGASCAE